MNDSEFKRSQEAILGSTVVDLAHYKNPQMRRRLIGYVAPTGLIARA